MPEAEVQAFEAVIRPRLEGISSEGLPI
jgi:hypothetical protein